MVERADQAEFGVRRQRAGVNALGGQFVTGRWRIAPATRVTDQAYCQNDGMPWLQRSALSLDIARGARVLGESAWSL